MSTSEAAVEVPDLWSRWSDRLNPILVREVKQAVKSRMFFWTVLAALLVSVLIAVVVVSEAARRDSVGSGRDAFDAGLATLVPLVLFVVPMQAYQSMRLELRVGIAEQLLLSRLGPARIVVGKLTAALVQLVLYVSVLAPLLATSYLLRGVDLPIIGLSLAFAVLGCVAATAIAVSAAAQAIVPALQPLANLSIAFGLGIAGFGGMGYVGTGEYARDVGWLWRSTEFWPVVSAFCLGGLASTVMSSLVAQAYLAHAYENRSTGFRVWLFVLVLVAFGWLFVAIDPGDHAVGASVLSLLAWVTIASFGLFFVTEQRTLSPRVRAHVPRQPLLAVLAAPFLPGRDRGMAAVILAFALVAGAFAYGTRVATSMGFLEGLRETVILAAPYVLFWLAVARFLRARLPDVPGANTAARVLTPLLLVAACLVPVLFDVFLAGHIHRWHWGHVMNPFFTLEEWTGRGRSADGAVVVAIATTGILVVLHLPVIVRAAAEVVRAAQQRRTASRPGASVG